ncbi:MAG: helix-turn-helix domain-containing protein, partial [Prevotella sp.]
MEEAIKQIGERLKGLREVLDIPIQDVANLCGLSVDTYEKMENGEGELSISSLQKISQKYGIALDVLLFGEEPHMGSYFLT